MWEWISQTKKFSSDEVHENENDGKNELMGNLAPYDYEPERAIASSSEETESSEMKLLVVMLLVKMKTISWDV